MLPASNNQAGSSLEVTATPWWEVNTENTCFYDYDCPIDINVFKNGQRSDLPRPRQSDLCCATFPHLVRYENGYENVEFDKLCYDKRVFEQQPGFVIGFNPYQQAYCDSALCGLSGLSAMVALIITTYLF